MFRHYLDVFPYEIENVFVGYYYYSLVNIALQKMCFL